MATYFRTQRASGNAVYGDFVANEVSPGPTITTQPTAKTITEGAQVTFQSAAVSSGGVMTSQWYKSPSSILSGQTGDTLVFTPTLADSGSAYYNTYTDDNGSTSTVAALLTVNAAAGPIIESVNDSLPIPNLASYPTTGTNLLGTTGSTINGVAQDDYVVTNDARVDQTAVRPQTLKYGITATYAIETGTRNVTMQAQADWDYVTITSIADSGAITTVPGLSVGDQIAWDTQGGTITVNPDGTVTAVSPTGSFDAEAFDPAGNWGVLGVVTLSEGDSAPAVLTPIADQTLYQGDTTTLDITGNFSGADSYTASPLPGGVSFSNGVFSGVVSTVQAIDTVVTATNANGSTPDTFKWTVLSASPTLTAPIDDQTIQQNDTVSLDVTGNFNGATSYTASPLPGGITFTNGVFSGAPSGYGTSDTTVTASNAYGSVQDTFQWDVTEAPVAVRKKFVFKMDEGSGDVITNSDPDTGAAFNGSWSNDTGWTNFPANSRFYPANEGSGDTVANSLDPSGATDGTIQNYTDNWT